MSSRAPVVVGLVLGMALAAMEATVVSTVMPTVVADLGGLDLYGWVGAAYLLSATVTTPVFGKLADQWGRRRLTTTSWEPFRNFRRRRLGLRRRRGPALSSPATWSLRGQWRCRRSRA